MFHYYYSRRCSRAVLESLKLDFFQWYNAPVVIFLEVYCLAQFAFFSVVPVVLAETGATSLHLTLLTANYFNVLCGMLLHQYKVIIVCHEN